MRAIWVMRRIRSWPGWSAGCALPANNSSTGRCVVADQLPEPVQVLEQQRGALVGGEAAGEADGQHVGIDRVGVLEQPVQVRLRAAVAEVLARDAEAHQVQHLRLERLAHAPEQVVGYLVYAPPEAVVGDALAPVEAEVLLEHLAPLLRQEGGHVHAVGDVGQRVLGAGRSAATALRRCARTRRRGCG